MKRDLDRIFYVFLGSLALIAGSCGRPADRAAAVSSSESSHPSGSVEESPQSGFSESALAGIPGGTIAGQILDPSQHPLKDAVVHIAAGLGPGPYARPPGRPSIKQKDKTFRPHVLPVLVGAEVELPNLDNVLHNVYSRSGPKSFDLGMYPSPESRTVTFDKPGKVDLYCAVHTNMYAIVLVLENPFFAVTDARGIFQIPNAPQGDYTLRIWHEAFGEEPASIKLRASSASIVRIVMRGS